MPGALLEVDIDKICTTPARESDLEVKIVKNWHAGSTFGSWHRQNLHHVYARERFFRKKRHHAACSEHFWKLSFPKFAPRLRARAIWKSKSLKTDGLGTFFELGSKCVSRGRRRDFDTLHNTWQAQEFVRVAKTLAGVVDLKRVRNNAFRVAGAMISRFVMSMFEASDAETVEG